MLLTLCNQYFKNKFQERFIINKKKVNNFETLVIVFGLPSHLLHFHKSISFLSLSLFWILHRYFEKVSFASLV